MCMYDTSSFTTYIVLVHVHRNMVNQDTSATQTTVRTHCYGRERIVSTGSYYRLLFSDATMYRILFSNANYV